MRLKLHLRAKTILKSVIYKLFLIKNMTVLT